MSTPCEYTLVEKPIIELLTSAYGYHYVAPSQHEAMRGVRENEVFFTPLLIDALVRINDIPISAAKSIAAEFVGVSDNERWLDIMRGDLSRHIEGEESHRTIRVVDFDNAENNHFAVTNQLKIHGAKHCKPDLILYLNGIPVVVLEAKSPLAPTSGTFKAVSQIQQYEENIPRLFAPNLFNIATNDLTLLYGATGAPSQFWSAWRDPWPRKAAEFSDASAQGVYSLLSPERLLDILAHFIIFETRDGKTTKKMCRYQQYRAVNKMVDRIVGADSQQGDARQGLIWHTQGSGKSLTMVFAALKLKFHRGIQSERLENPNLLVITDRKALHEQISKTFAACGLPNPQEATSKNKLRELLGGGAAGNAGEMAGRTVISTIFKFQKDELGLKSLDKNERKEALAKMEIPGSGSWILMVDEAHRTQEKDLGAYLRAVLPNAVRFGFTGTPVKKGDKDTFRNFGVMGESYLDKYGIQDAVNDGATVPVYYQGRMTEWHIEGAELDILFDQYFANESEERIAELRERGVTRGDLARFRPRIEKIAYDLWTHYRTHVMPDGFKAQVVAVDRPACAVYKEELDRVIASTLVSLEGLSEEEARAQAAAMSVCIYSAGQHDQQDHPELVRYQLDDQQVKDAVKNFNEKDNPKILIVCNKLLTGFDAPVEQAMYLDSPLADHNLLQAIARTNRTWKGAKTHGTIVDYIGVSKNLAKALAAYNDDDIAGALTNEDELYADLQNAHREVMLLLQDASRTGDPKADAMGAVYLLQAEDTWFDFLGKANAFLVAYGALSPDPRVFMFKADLKFVGSIIPYGKQIIDASEAPVDWRQYSEKIREILHLHLKVTGLHTVTKLRSMSEEAFWEDFSTNAKGKDLKTAAVKKLVELKKETSERAEKNPARYEKFSQRVQELIEKLQKGLIDAKEAMDGAKKTATDTAKEDAAFKTSGLNEKAYNVSKILEKFLVAESKEEGEEPGGKEPGAKASPAKANGAKEATPSYGKKPSAAQQAAAAIDELYRTDELASSYWQDKPQSRKKLLQLVRRIVKPLNLSDWKAFASSVDHYAVRHYPKP